MGLKTATTRRRSTRDPHSDGPFHIAHRWLLTDGCLPLMTPMASLYTLRMGAPLGRPAMTFIFESHNPSCFYGCFWVLGGKTSYFLYAINCTQWCAHHTAAPHGCRTYALYLFYTLCSECWHYNYGSVLYFPKAIVVESAPLPVEMNQGRRALFARFLALPSFRHFARRPPARLLYLRMSSGWFGQ